MRLISTSRLMLLLPMALLISAQALVAETDSSTLLLVKPPLPDTFVMIRDGNISQGAFESESGKIKALSLSEGEVSWKIELTWSDDQLASVDKIGENPKLNRTIHTQVVIEKDQNGRIQAQHVHARGRKLYEVRYEYGSFELPQGATVTSGNGQVMEQVRYEYGDTAWERPICLFHGLHFGQVRTYSNYSTKGDEMILFSIADYNEEGWGIKSLTILGSTDIPGEVQEFTYGKRSVQRK